MIAALKMAKVAPTGARLSPEAKDPCHNGDRADPHPSVREKTNALALRVGHFPAASNVNC
jgi:hypothetical protein